jgi:putative nucleotidyltransferase with HDIG domain
MIPNLQFAMANLQFAISSFGHQIVGGTMTRDEAWALLNEYTKGEGLIKHALSVEAAMRAYARQFGEDEDMWGLTGLLHDFDYERWPNPPDHPLKGCEILRAKGCPEEIVYAVQSHAKYLGVARKSRMDKTLFAVDELTGMVTATALVQPSRSLSDLQATSVLKKMKSKGFARSINREDIVEGAAELGVDLEAHVAFVVQAMQGIAPQLGL